MKSEERGRETISCNKKNPPSPSRPMWELRTDFLKSHSRASGVMEETPSYPKGKILPGALGSTVEYLCRELGGW